jgi:mono/diheme cytochrome c family protein
MSVGLTSSNRPPPAYAWGGIRPQMFCVFMAFMSVALLSLAVSARTVQNNVVHTTLDGVFSAGQAAKGEMEYQDTCAKCHDGDNAAGPSLVGQSFVDRWREDNLEVLYDFIKTNMPAGDAGSLSDDDYLNLVAHILDVNGFREGPKEMTAGELPKIRLVGKDGPKPLPNNTLVQVVGCLTQNSENDWTVTKASSPARIRQGTETSPEELKKSTEEPLGSEVFKLQNFARLSLDFKPDPYKDHKVQVKGVLTHQSSGNDRISLTALNSLTTSCMQ